MQVLGLGVFKEIRAKISAIFKGMSCDADAEASNADSHKIILFTNSQQNFIFRKKICNHEDRAFFIWIRQHKEESDFSKIKPWRTHQYKEL